MPHTPEKRGTSEYRDIKRKFSEIKVKGDLLDKLERCILSDEERAVITMHFIQHKSLDYIVDALAISYSTAHRRLKAALKALDQTDK